jgi:hypothetical protein
MSASLGLFRLQQVDRQIDQTQSELDTIRKELENDVELRQTLSRVEAAKKDQHLARHDLQMAEAAGQSQQIKIQQAESSLYGGSVHNPKELQDLQNDVASLKRHLSSLEERELEAMTQVDSAERTLQLAESELAKLQSRLGNEHQKLIEKQSALLNNLERLSEEREAAIAPIESRLLELYEGLRQQKRGVAVAEVSDKSCSACGTNLNAALQQNARSATQIVHCPTCGRILFAD